jgi:hypothetical protein
VEGGEGGEGAPRGSSRSWLRRRRTSWVNSQLAGPMARPSRRSSPLGPSTSACARASPASAGAHGDHGEDRDRSPASRRSGRRLGYWDQGKKLSRHGHWRRRRAQAGTAIQPRQPTTCGNHAHHERTRARARCSATAAGPRRRGSPPRAAGTCDAKATPGNHASQALFAHRPPARADTRYRAVRVSGEARVTDAPETVC